MKRYWTHIVLISLLIAISFGQGFCQNHIGNLIIKNKYKADQYFLDLYYEKAIEYYKMALKKEPNKDVIRLRIGDCYRLLHDYERAAYWYAQVIENQSELEDPIYKYHYANMLESIEEPEEAITWFESYQEDFPDDSRTARKLYGLNNQQIYFQDIDITEVDLLPFNTLNSELAPVQYKNELIFVSSGENLSIIDHSR